MEKKIKSNPKNKTSRKVKKKGTFYLSLCKRKELIKQQLG